MTHWIGLSLLAWVGVWIFWLVFTNQFHPSFALAVIVTTSLVVAYATSVYINHQLLIPRCWRAGNRLRYAAFLALTMVALTGMALAVIRVSYFKLSGPDVDPNGVYKHFLIDLFGMAVHLSIAWIIVWSIRRSVGHSAADAQTD